MSGVFGRHKLLVFLVEDHVFFCRKLFVLVEAHVGFRLVVFDVLGPPFWLLFQKPRVLFVFADC